MRATFPTTFDQDCSFVVFHSPQRRIVRKLNLSNSNMSVKSDNQVKYLGLIFDSNLNWKPYFHEFSKKISRGIGVPSKIRYHVNRNILLQLYYSLIYPFLHLRYINMGQYLWLHSQTFNNSSKESNTYYNLSETYGGP